MSTDDSSPPPARAWRELLSNMRFSHDKPFFKPVCLLAAIDEAQSTQTGTVAFKAVSQRFDRLISDISPHDKGKAWQPFFHLCQRNETAGAWALTLNGKPAVIQAGWRPKSAGPLRKCADAAIMHPDLHREVRNAPNEVLDLIRSYLPNTKKKSPSTKSSASQGRGLTHEQRKAVENWSVSRAVEYFAPMPLKDVGSRESWDLEGIRNGAPLRIEVKGSTGGLDKIILTRNEVRHAKECRDGNAIQLALVLVEHIQLQEPSGDEKWHASGGTLKVIDPWIVQEGGLSASQYEYTLPLEAE